MTIFYWKWAKTLTFLFYKKYQLHHFNSFWLSWKCQNREEATKMFSVTFHNYLRLLSVNNALSWLQGWVLRICQKMLVGWLWVFAVVSILQNLSRIFPWGFERIVISRTIENKTRGLEPKPCQDLTWPELTWLDLTWTDLIWPDLTWPELNQLDLTWPNCNTS